MDWSGGIEAHRLWQRKGRLSEASGDQPLALPPPRATTRLTVIASHRPPRGDLMPCRFSSSAMALSDVTPPARTACRSG